MTSEQRKRGAGLARMGCGTHTPGHRQVECPSCSRIVVQYADGHLSWHGVGAKHRGGSACPAAGAFMPRLRRAV